MASFEELIKKSAGAATPAPTPAPTPKPAASVAPIAPAAAAPKPASPFPLPSPKPAPVVPQAVQGAVQPESIESLSSTPAPLPAADPSALLDKLAATTSESVKQATLSPGEIRLQELASLGHEERVLDFVRTLQSVPMLSEQGDLDALRGAIRIIWAELAKNPALAEHVRPQDFGAVIRSLRTSMGVAAVTVKEKKEKRAKTTTANAAVDNVFGKALAGLDF